MADTARHLTVEWLRENRVSKVESGALLLDAARAAGIDVAAPCNGAGTCGKCRVRVASAGVAAATADELARLSADEVAGGVRLACRARVTGDVQVETLDRAASATAVLGSGAQRAFARDAFDAAAGSGRLGVAIDIGTTTVAVGLLDLATGEEFASATAVNPQTAYGHDVLTRVLHAAQPGGLDQLAAAVRSCVDDAVSEACALADAQRSDIRAFAVAANTVMTHLLLAIDPASLGRAPYVPAEAAPAPVSAKSLGWAAAPDAEVFCVPAVSAFVGGDIVAGLLATGLPQAEELTLFVDMGTNGEIVLGSREGLWACSCAAGPAFEGMGISSGMRAAPGAIDGARVTPAGTIELTTIGDEPARGLCGSGVIDVAAALLEAGVIGESGRFTRADAAAGAAWAAGLRSGPTRYVLAEGDAGEIGFSQKDVRQVQLAKGAVASGIRALLDAADVTTGDVKRVLIAGQFGHHVRKESLAALGLVPTALEPLIEVAGNTSKSGAAMCLLSRVERESAGHVAREITHVELSTLPGFDRLLAECMLFPQPISQ
jgi:uncharacterized 2Fe-2S/4Fe-4S cluster protein (DUF4445 family)